MGIGFSMSMAVPCESCGGKGKTAAGNCPRCKGNKISSEDKFYNIVVEKGMADGARITFKADSD